MGTRQKLYDGLMILPQELADFSNVASNTGGSLTSSYQEAEPRPGIPRADQDGARAAIRISAEQGTDLAFQCNRAGIPELETGARVIVRDTAGSAPWYGWNDPGLLVGWAPIDYAPATSIAFHAAAVNERTGAAFSVYSDNTGASPYSASRWDPITWEWTAPITFGIATSPPAVFSIPGTDRIVSIGSTSYYTDDNGSTWNVYATSCDALLGVGAWSLVLDKGDAASLDGDVLLLFWQGGFIYQYTSTDLGATYRQTNAAADPIGPGSLCTSLGRYVIGYVASFSGDAECRILGTAGSNIDNAAPITIDNSRAYVECRVVSEPDGIIWAFCRPLANPNELVCFISKDGGNSWRLVDDGIAARDLIWNSGSASDFLRNMVPVHSAGYLLNITQWTADVGVFDDSLAAIVLGGWSNLGTIKPLSREVILNNYSNSPTNTPRSWVPIELPENTGQWTKTGSGTAVLEAPGKMRISTVLNNAYYTSAGSTFASTGMSWFFDLEIVGPGALGTDQIIFEGQIANGTDEKVCRLRFTSSAVQVFDPTAALTKATINIDTQIRRQYCMVIQDNFSNREAFDHSDLHKLTRYRDHLI